MAAISKPHWRDVAIERGQIITDVWQVLNSYAGRLAEIVLFACMIINIITMLPGVQLATTLTSAVLGVQIVSLDIGGLSLSSMAHHARENGATKSAEMATLTSKFLVGLMVVTLVTVSIGLLWPVLTQYTQMIEKIMILVRIIMSVLYSSVIHSLRTNVLSVTPAQQQPLHIEEENAPTDAPLLEEAQPEQQNETGVVLERSESVKVAPKSAPTAKEKAQKILKRTPDIDAATLAAKLECSPAYARKLIAQQQKGN